MVKKGSASALHAGGGTHPSRTHPLGQLTALKTSFPPKIIFLDRTLTAIRVHIKQLQQKIKVLSYSSKQTSHMQIILSDPAGAGALPRPRSILDESLKCLGVGLCDHFRRNLLCGSMSIGKMKIGRTGLPDAPSRNSTPSSARGDTSGLRDRCCSWNRASRLSRSGFGFLKGGDGPFLVTFPYQIVTLE